MRPVHTRSANADTFDFPGVITFKVLLSGAQTGGTHAVFEDIVQPGQGPGRHIHHAQDETFLFEEGEFDVEIDGVRHHMKPGDLGFVPKGSVHAFKNVGDVPGRLRYVFTPAGTFEDMVRELYALSEGSQPDPEDMARFALDHGQEFVGPPLE
ncbi:MAG: cupin domain-containing protein [Boseongicola sp.]|nr:cupin domain-containing protein [Boseongicola sp.]MDD9977620.1 cupin domain-containing protein [Boseongicola sp.]